MVINLQEPYSLPSSFLKQLKKCDSYFEQELYLENVREIPVVSHLIKDINDFCSENMVVGFHYTRAIPEDLLAQGLLIRSGEQIRAEFINRFGYIFSHEEIVALKSAWANYFGASMIRARDNRIFFNFTTTALNNGGAEPLLRNFGGEQVYFCIDELPNIGEKISSIGQPLIVKCALLPSHVHTYIEHPWGSIVTSSYHRTVNSDAHQTDQDGWQAVPVPPEQIEFVSLG